MGNIIFFKRLSKPKSEKLSTLYKNKNTKMTKSQVENVVRSWSDVDYSLKIVLWATMVNSDEVDVDEPCSIFFNTLVSNDLEYGSHSIKLGQKGVRIRNTLNYVLKDLAIDADGEDVYHRFCRHVASKVKCSVTEVMYAICKVDWCDYQVDGDVESEEEEIQFDEPFDKDGESHWKLSGLEEMTVQEIPIVVEEVANSVNVSDWLASTSIDDVRGSTKSFFHLCHGRRVKLDGKQYGPGVSLVNAIRRYIKPRGFRYRDWLAAISERTGIQTTDIDRIVRNGMSTPDGMREISKPIVTGVEHIITEDDCISRAERKSEYVEKYVEHAAEVVERKTKKTKKVIRGYTELWDIQKTEKLCRDLANDPKIWVFFDVLARGRVSTDKRNYELDVAYRHSKSRDSGREYADGASFQSLNGAMRRYMCGRNDESPGWELRDIDVDNCFPVLLYQICKKHGLELSAMKEYVDRREEILQDAMERYGVKRGVAKTMFLIEMHGGWYFTAMMRDHGFTREQSKTIKFPFMKRFKHDVERAFDTLQHIDEFKTVYTEVMDDVDKKNKRGTFISYICQDAESNVISNCVKACDEWGYDVSTLVFDGFMVKWDDVADNRRHATMDEYLKDISKYVLDSTGFDLGFSNKSLDLKPSDLRRLSPDNYIKQDHFGFRTTKIGLADMPVVETKSGPRAVMKPFTDEYRVTCVTAGMFLGKSTTSKAYLKRVLEDPSATAIALSVRKQQARTLKGDLSELGFRHYRDDLSVSGKGRVIFQYESIHKLLDDLLAGSLRYDYVILDESHSILKNIVSETNKNNLKASAETIKLILQMSKKVLCLDADNGYDATVPEYLGSIFDSADIEHLHYTHQGLKRKVVYTDEHTWRSTLLDDMANNRNAMVCFKSCKKLMAWYNTVIDDEFYINEAGEKVEVKLGVKFAVKSFSSESKDSDMEIFENINDLPPTGLFLAFTSKVLVGADILIPFHRLYLDANGYRGPTPRQMIQMLGRGRVCTTGEILVTMPRPKKTSEAKKKLDYTTLYQSQFKELVNRRQTRESYVQTVLDSFKRKWNGTAIVWTPDPILKIYAHQEVERSREFSVEFHSMVASKGYDMEFRYNRLGALGEGCDKFEWKESLIELGERRDLEFNQALESIQKLPIEDILRHCGEAKYNKSGTKAESIVNDIAFACKMFPEHYKELTVKDVKYIIQNKGVVYLANSVYSKDSPDVFLRDILNMKYAAIPELSKLSGTYIHLIDRLLCNVGYSGGVLDRETEIPEGVLVGNLSNYTSEMTKLEKSRGSIRCKSGKKLTILRAELRQIGLRLVNKVTRHSRKSWTKRYRLILDPTLERLIPHMRTNYFSCGGELVDRVRPPLSETFTRTDTTVTEKLMPHKVKCNLGSVDRDDVLGPIGPPVVGNPISHNLGTGVNSIMKKIQKRSEQAAVDLDNLPMFLD